MKGDSTLSVRLSFDFESHRGGPDFGLDVAFDAAPGVTILFGPSGAGKSTTLAAIAGLVRPSAGRVALGDQVWFDSQSRVNRPIHHRGVSFVFQTPALFPHLTGLENVMFGLDRQLPKSERRRRALEMMERMKVPNLAGRKPRTFSGGEAQRVALARAFARAPRLVLLDEAFSALDRQLRRELCAEVRAMVAELGIAAINVTHHRNEARLMGDRVVLIEEGRIVATGSIEELLGRDPPTPER